MIIIKYTNIEFRSCFLRFYVLWWCAECHWLRTPLGSLSITYQHVICQSMEIQVFLYNTLAA